MAAKTPKGIKRAAAKAAWDRFNKWYSRGANGEDSFSEFDNLELARKAFSLGLEEGLRLALDRINAAKRAVEDFLTPERR